MNCPHCFNTIKNEFPRFGGSYKVVPVPRPRASIDHFGASEISAEFSKRTVYHDSCSTAVTTTYLTSHGCCSAARGLTSRDGTSP